MSLTFYYAPFSSSASVHWALEELEIPYEKVKMDLRSGDLKKPAFLALNPNGMVPTIVHDGVAIFESAAIIAHLGENFGVEKGLYPPAGPKSGEALKWLVWTNVQLGGAMGRLHHASSERFPAERHNAFAAEAAKKDLESLLGILDRAMTGKKYLGGDTFGLVDVHVAGWVAYLGMLGIDAKPFPALAPWVAACTARPGYRTAMSP